MGLHLYVCTARGPDQQHEVHTSIHGGNPRAHTTRACCNRWTATAAPQSLSRKLSVFSEVVVSLVLQATVMEEGGFVGVACMRGGEVCDWSGGCRGGRMGEEARKPWGVP